MKRRVVIVALIAALAFAGGAFGAGAAKLFQGWTGTSDVVSNGGSLTLSQGGALFMDGGCVDLQDTFVGPPGPTHSVVVCNWGIGLTKYGTPNVSAYIVTGSADPTLGTDVTTPPGSLYLQHRTNETGAMWAKTGTGDASWTCVAGCP